MMKADKENYNYAFAPTADIIACIDEASMKT